MSIPEPLWYRKQGWLLCTSTAQNKKSMPWSMDFPLQGEMLEIAIATPIQDSLR